MVPIVKFSTSQMFLKLKKYINSGAGGVRASAHTYGVTFNASVFFTIAPRPLYSLSWIIVHSIALVLLYMHAKKQPDRFVHLWVISKLANFPVSKKWANFVTFLAIILRPLIRFAWPMAYSIALLPLYIHAKNESDRLGQFWVISQNPNFPVSDLWSQWCNYFAISPHMGVNCWRGPSFEE